MLKKLFAYLPLAAMFIMSLLFFVLPARDFSENENRYLKKFPEFKFEALLKGNFTGDLELYAQDHFPFRDTLVGLHSFILKAAGTGELSGIYMIPGGSLVEAYDHPGDTERIIRIFNDFAKKTEQNITLFLVPTAVSIYNDSLPDYAPDKEGFRDAGYISQQDTMGEIFGRVDMNSVSCEDLLKAHRDEYIFYHSDHHWTALGAYYGYLTLCESMGITPVDWDSLDMQPVTEEFRGTLYSRSGDYSVKTDTMELPGERAGNVLVEYMDTGEVTDSLYNLDYLGTKDKYAMYLDRTHDLVRIESLVCDDDRRLVLIKDSFANALLPCLIHNFSEIYVFDTRYYKSRVSEFVGEHSEITDVLLVFNMNTFDRDLAVKGIY